jgi:hypothetical protein
MRLQSLSLFMFCADFSFNPSFFFFAIFSLLSCLFRPSSSTLFSPTPPTVYSLLLYPILLFLSFTTFICFHTSPFNQNCILNLYTRLVQCLKGSVPSEMRGVKKMSIDILFLFEHSAFLYKIYFRFRTLLHN